MVPQRCPCPSPQKRELLLPDKNDLVDVIKLKTLRWWDNPGISGCVQTNPHNRETEGSERENWKCYGAGFDDEGTMNQDGLEQGMDSPRASRRNSPTNTLILATGDSFRASDLQNCKITDLCYMKPLN